jgi:membrane protease YdiL (CAAX protease family)
MDEPKDERPQPPPAAPGPDGFTDVPLAGLPEDISGEPPTVPLEGAVTGVPPAPPRHLDVRHPSHLGFWIVLLALGAGYIGLWFAGQEAQKVAAAGLESLPFLGLALLATLGLRFVWARALTVVYWLLLVGGVGLTALGFTFLAIADPQTLGKVLTAQQTGIAATVPPGGSLFLPGGPQAIVLSLLGIGLGGLLGLLGFVPAVQQACARLLPLDPHSFVHATALATVFALTAICFVPLLAVGHPPLLLFLKHFEGEKILEGLSKEDQLRDQLYGLAWLVPAALMAAGYPLRRTLPQALRRVGLVRPRAWQVSFALVAAAALAFLIGGVDAGIGWLWKRLGWPETDSKAFEDLMKFAINPLGAVVIGVTAGLGEELAVRGLLQPRLGILLSNLFFTALHAFQYNFDALLSVFLIGLILGVIRKYTNTTTSAVVHGTYDFLQILLSYLGFQGF